MSTPLPSQMESKSRPVRALASVAAATVVLASGLPPLTPDPLDWIGPAVGLVGLVITAGLVPWTERRTVPWENVAAKVTESGKVVAGPAAEQPNGTTVTVTDGATGGPVPYPGR